MSYCFGKHQIAASSMPASCNWKTTVFNSIHTVEILAKQEHFAQYISIIRTTSSITPSLNSFTAYKHDKHCSESDENQNRDSIIITVQDKYGRWDQIKEKSSRCNSNSLFPSCAAPHFSRQICKNVDVCQTKITGRSDILM
jgi:hypothetical protein